VEKKIDFLGIVMNYGKRNQAQIDYKTVQAHEI
jgi:hypothetical protein